MEHEMCPWHGEECPHADLKACEQAYEAHEAARMAGQEEEDDDGLDWFLP